MNGAGAPSVGTHAKALIALAGNPNSGKTTLFNALTGLRQKVANYPGVTVERKMGTLRIEGGDRYDVLDLPGAYSLVARSPDEEIARRVLLGEMLDTPRPDMVVVVLDASNLERNLYLAGQIIEMGVRTVLALNMMDVAEAMGIRINADALAAELGVPVLPMVASQGVGVEALRRLVAEKRWPPPQSRRWRLAAPIEKAIAHIAALLQEAAAVPAETSDAEAVRLIGRDGTPERVAARGGARLADAVQGARDALEAAGVDPLTFEAENRYRWIREALQPCVAKRDEYTPTRSDRADALLTHRILGPVVFLAAMALVFQTIFAWASYPMDLMDAGVRALGAGVSAVLAEGPFRSLLVDGVLGGVGAVVVFLPQILFLFFFIGLLEDTGYMARAAFMMDRVMRRVGLHGKAFIPLLSSFACAVPGIMATRTIESPRDRLVTILVAPLMSCSARLPIYALLIAAFIPGSALTKAAALTGLYALGILTAIGAALVLKRTLLRGQTPPLILELPPYRWPSWKSVLLNMWDRSRHFLQRAGTIILSISIILWSLVSYPRHPAIAAEFAGQREEAARTASGADLTARLESLDAEEAGVNLRSSLAGHMGRLIEPVLAPLGFDWKIGIGIIASFAAREVFVSTMGTIYSVGEVDEDVAPLAQRLREARWDGGPQRGEPIYTLPVAVGLLVFYVLALQCMSTVATIWRETASWKWPLVAWTYMAVLAYVAAWVANRVVGLVV